MHRVHRDLPRQVNLLEAGGMKFAGGWDVDDHGQDRIEACRFP